MVLTADVESLIHLIARALAKTSGNQAPHVFADVVLEHAKALAGSHAAAVVADVKEVVEPAQAADAAPASTEPVVAAPVEAAPAEAAAAPALTTESVMEKVEGFVDHLLHPEANQPPSA